MRLEELVGNHLLEGFDGFDFDNLDEECAKFKLDGIIYKISIDEEDGYRSYLRELEICDSIKNTFTGIPVLCVMDSDVSNEILHMFDLNGEKIFSIGTSSWDDYYPCAITEFTPKLLEIIK